MEEKNEKVFVLHGIEFPNFHDSEYGQGVKSEPFTLGKLEDMLNATQAVEHLMICGISHTRESYKDFQAATQYLVKYRTLMYDILEKYYPDEHLKLRQKNDKAIRERIFNCPDKDYWKKVGENYHNFYGDTYGPDKDGLFICKGLGF